MPAKYYSDLNLPPGAGAAASGYDDHFLRQEGGGNGFRLKQVHKLIASQLKGGTVVRG